MKKVAFMGIILISCIGCSANQEQKEAWNHFWGIKTPESRSYFSPGTNYPQPRQSYKLNIDGNPVAVVDGKFVIPEKNMQLMYNAQKKASFSQDKNQYDIALRKVFR